MDPEQLARELHLGNRRALAKAITLVESSLPHDRQQARQLLAKLPVPPPVMRVGITGAPGVGKSTFIDRLGSVMVADGWRPAVLAYDPAGQRGGSLLGDKTRMQALTQSPAAFVRPSSNRGSAGGIGPGAFDAVRLCEASGYNPVIVETVGSGQAELSVVELSDLLVLLLLPDAGDEVTGFKKGVLEHADLVLVNKADGTQRERAQRAARDYERALALVAGGRAGQRERHVELVSAREGSGVSEVWQTLQARFADGLRSGQVAEARARKLGAVFRQRLSRELEQRLWARPALARLSEQAEQRLLAGEVGLGEAVDELLAVVFNGLGEEP